jgi:hypothetical protein
MYIEEWERSSPPCNKTTRGLTVLFYVDLTSQIYPADGFGSGGIGVGDRSRAEGPTATTPQAVTVTVTASDKSGNKWTKDATVTL